MTAEIVRFPLVDRPVRRDIVDSAIVIVLPIVRVERYAFEMPSRRAGKTEKMKVRRRARRRED